MIETKVFKQTQKEYFNIILKVQFKRRWWIIALLILFSAYNFFKIEEESAKIVWVLFPIVYIIALYFQNRWFAYSKKNAIFFNERKLFFDENMMRFEIENKTTSEVLYSNIIEIKQLENCWMLYIAKHQFIHVPKNIFYKEEDFERFKEYINQ